MNVTTAVMLINPNVRAIHCSYEASPTEKTLFKTLNTDIKIGDYVVVPTKTRHNLTVVKVEDVDVDVDFDSPKQVDWIVCKVDKAEYESILEQEGMAIQAIKSAELRRKREQLRDSLFADHAASLNTLAIASAGNVAEEPKA